MKSLREQFEADYTAAQVPDKSRKGFHVTYVYTAPWQIWDLPGKELKGKKAELVVINVLGMLLFIIAGTRQTPANRNVIISIAGSLVLCTEAFLLSGLLRFVAVKHRTTRSSFSSIDLSLKIASALQGILLFALSILCIACFLKEGLNTTDIGTACLYGISAAAASILSREYRKVPHTEIRNDADAEWINVPDWTDASESGHFFGCDAGARQ